MILSENSVRKLIKQIMNEITYAQVRLDTSAGNLAAEDDPNAFGVGTQGNDSEIDHEKGCKTLYLITDAEIPGLLGSGAKRCSGVDFNLTNKTKKIIKLIFLKAFELGYKADGVLLSSGYRGPDRQSRAMFKNWKKNGGPSGGREYLVGLYRDDVLAEEMADSFERTNDWKDGANILRRDNNIKKISNHWNGNTFDITGYAAITQEFKDEVLNDPSIKPEIAQILDETKKSGPHWHIGVKGTGHGVDFSNAAPEGADLDQEEKDATPAGKFYKSVGHVDVTSYDITDMYVIDEYENALEIGGVKGVGKKPSEYRKYTLRKIKGGPIIDDSDGRPRVFLAADDGGETWDYSPLLRRVYSETGPFNVGGSSTNCGNSSGNCTLDGVSAWEIVPGVAGSRVSSPTQEQLNDLDMVKQVLNDRVYGGKLQ